MRIKKLYVDMDGVLADFDRGVEELCGIEKHDQEERDESLIDAMWEKIRGVGHFYDRLEPMPGALDMLERLKKICGETCDIEILTGLPKPVRGIKDAAEDKIKWAHRNISPGIIVNTGIREDKVKFCKGKDCVLIDDLRANVSEWEKHGGTGILHRSPEETLKAVGDILRRC